MHETGPDLQRFVGFSRISEFENFLDHLLYVPEAVECIVGVLVQSLENVLGSGLLTISVQSVEIMQQTYESTPIFGNDIKLS